MKCKLNGKSVDVIPLNADEVYGVAADLLEAVGVAEGEFPSKGTVYIYQIGVDDPKQQKSCHAEMVALAKQCGGEKVPPRSALARFDWEVFLEAQYEIVCPEKGEYAMHFLGVRPLETRYGIEEDGTFYEQEGEESKEEMRKHWQDFIIPIPPPPKSGSDEVFLTLAYEFYDAIKAGTKKTEYRDYTENWVKKLLSRPVRTVKFQRGYGGPGRPAPEQMVWTVSRISLFESETKTKGDPSNPPKGMIPDCIAIDLGKQVS